MQTSGKIKVPHNQTLQLKVRGNWAVQSRQLKEKFPQLTESDLIFEAGHEEALLKRLEVRLNKDRNAVINIITNSNTLLS
ncbi:MAG: hypothetical protein KGK14_12260 [Bacteroidota bacterium]|nr:hypothetical protein [Bacteroidota bacterium]